MSRRTSRKSGLTDTPSLPEPTRRSRSTRNTADDIKPDPEPENENNAGPSSKRPSLRARTATQDDIADPEDGDTDGDGAKPYRVRNRKSVSYKEIPVDADLELDIDVDVDVEEEDGGSLTSAGEEKETPPQSKRKSQSQAPDTPSRRRKATEDDKDKDDKSFRSDNKVGSGRGGFSVKGAAAAAARARWAKVRAEKAERGDDDDSKERKKGRVIRRENRAAVEKLKDGEVISIRGVQYVVKNDELPIPDDPKGETKIDYLGNLKGGREYKIFTFTSEGRDNSEILYALTIDVARTCGYSDSLAFLRRYPVIQKLQCQPGEAEMLVEVGRVAGNMKHRMVTIVPVHNVFKLMGARIIKDGKWVTDDYYEDESLAKCAENGFTPYAPVQEEEIIANTQGMAGVRGEREREQLISISKTNALSPFYTLGGPSTHFGGSGIDPWTEGGHGGRRTKLRGVGVSAEDWMYKTARECRGVDEVLRQYRAERVGVLEGKDLNGWVWVEEDKAERPTGTGTGTKALENGHSDSPKLDHSGLPSSLKPPAMDRQRSGLSREVTFEPEPTNDNDDVEGDISMDTIKPDAQADEEVLTPLEPLMDMVDKSTTEPVIRVETDEEALERKAKYAYGAGNWAHGTIKAAYEPHTHMPHIPLYTQPTIANIAQLSPYPLLSSASHSMNKGTVKGIASLEYVFEPQYGYDYNGSGQDEMRERERVIREAEEWERQNREKIRPAS